MHRSDEVTASSLMPHAFVPIRPRHHLVWEILVVLHQDDVKSDPMTDQWATHPSSEFLVEASLE